MRIEIEETSSGWYVRCGDRWEHGLTWDEALGTVASLIITKKAHYLKDATEHAIWESKYGYLQPRITDSRAE